MKALILILISFVAFAQKDTTTVTKKVVKIGDLFFVESKTVSVIYQPLDLQMVQTLEQIEEEKERKTKENETSELQRKEYVRLLKQAIKDGYKPPATNDFEQKIYNRILDKVKKEKL